ncbi:MAG: hypothetical protein LUI02_07040 [Clostridiales bacterium]|nr:hypothetical protein [Clostridiales bacterium]
MSNVWKQFYAVQQSNDKFVINANKIGEEKKRQRFIEERQREKAKKRAEAGFTEGIVAETVEIVPEKDPEETAKEILDEARDKADEMLNEANQKANLLIEDAQIQADQMYEDSKEAGYNEGAKVREDELEELKKQCLEDQKRMEGELEDKKAELDKQYDEKLALMEEEIIDSLIPVFEKVFRIELSDRRDVLFALIQNTMKNVELGKKLRIRVCEADKEMLDEHMEEIRAQAGPDVSIEVIQDVTFTDGECQLETSYGVFDCGIDTQLSGLMKEIKELA